MSRASAPCVEGVLLKLDLVGEHSPPKSRHYNSEWYRTEGQWQHKGLDDGDCVVWVANKAIRSTCNHRRRLKRDDAVRPVAAKTCDHPVSRELQRKVVSDERETSGQMMGASGDTRKKSAAIHARWVAATTG